jgi:SOS response associated peptidase (SRAP)
MLAHVQPVQHGQIARRGKPPVPRRAGPDGQSAALAGHLPRPARARGACRPERRARHGGDALGFPAAAEACHASGHERPQRGKPLLARLAYDDGNAKRPTWFALGPDRPLFAFAGIWRLWTGTRGTKAAPEEGEHRLFSFLTTEPNEVVRPVHAKAMPVILTGEECDLWLEADVPIALALQRRFPAERLAIVATGQRQGAAA